ncbi:hypothetical protein ACFFWD_30245 [Bradyrhizobium erythrophlei]|uniref:hypothetical protein n=1 Tax=Bradyrhizobium erythrophlei TaxID=1437360 RepID=UPI0035EA26B6
MTADGISGAGAVTDPKPDATAPAANPPPKPDSPGAVAQPADAPAPANDAVKKPDGAKVAPAPAKPDDAGDGDPSVDVPASHPVYYEKVDIVDDDPPRLDFIKPLTAQPPPLAVRALRRQIEDVCRLVRILFQDDKTRLDKFFRQLHLTADSGLRGQTSSVEIGLDNLQDVKDSIADAYTVVRGKLWWSNVTLLALSVLYCGIGTAVFRYNLGQWPWLATAGWQTLVVAALLIPVGTMAGLFIEFIFRVNDDIPYEQLRAINPGRWKPFQRALNTTIVALIFAAILAADIIKVGVSNVLLNEFVSGKPFLSLVIGFVTGFAFPYVRDLVQQVRPVSRDAAR